MTKYFSEEELKKLLSNKDFDEVLKDSGSKSVLVTINKKFHVVKRLYEVTPIDSSDNNGKKMVQTDQQKIKSGFEK